MYWCRTLGELALHADSSHREPLIRAGKSLAILAYLGLSPRRSESRDRIAQLFWRDASLSQAHHTLRQLLYRLRQAVPGEALLTLDGNSLSCSADVAFDALEGEKALEAGDAERAFSLLRGNFLEGFSLPESAEFEEWAESQRTRFREVFARAGEALIERAFAANAPERAIAVAEELKASNPLAESWMKILMTVLDRSGQPRRALAEYEAYRSLLASAVEDEPAPELESYARELELSLESLAANGTPRLPFVGRSAAWSRLLQAWSEAEEGRGTAVLVEGDAGLGKTRLIEEFAGRVRARGGIWVNAKCYEMEQALPYAVISHAVRSASSGPPLDGVAGRDEGGPASSADLLSLLAPVGPADEASTGEIADGALRLRAGVVSWIEGLSHRQPVLLSCDDIHWADHASLHLLHFIREELAGARILVLCSYRPAELSTVARRFAGSLVSEGLARLVTLTPLGVDDVEEVLGRLGRFPMPNLAGALAIDLHRHTGGNPLFIAELLETLESTGVLRIENGSWAIPGTFRIEELPKTLRKILADRVDSLPTEPRHALEVLSVLGEAADADLLADVLAASGPVAELALAELGKARLVRRMPLQTFEVAHDELRQLIYTAIPDDRRREVHGRVGAALEARGEASKPGGAGRLVRHFEQAGDAVRARAHALTAAGEAKAVGATEAHSRFLQLAEAYLPGQSSAGPAAERHPKARLRHLAWGAVATLSAIVVLGVLGDGRSAEEPEIGVRPWEHGSLYLADNGGWPSTVSADHLYRIRWSQEPGEHAEIIRVDRRPAAFPAQLLVPAVNLGSQTHTKIFRVAGPDTLQLTMGDTDDSEPMWSPDKRLIGVQRGWRVGDQYRFNLFVIDSEGHPVWRLTEGPWQDNLLDWSPDGSRIVLQRNIDTRYTLWLTEADGRRAENLSDAYELPTDREMNATFSPDGGRLAVAIEGAEALEILDLKRRLVEPVRMRCRLYSRLILWSPDGDWLALVCATDAGRFLMAVAADESSGPHLLAELPSASWVPVYWLRGLPRYVDRVRVRPAALDLSSGQGERLSAEVVDPAGQPMLTVIRWESSDSTVACVDADGYATGREAGAARIIASAGGFRADTSVVQVRPAPIDTLLFETWKSGIDTTRWKIVGDPAPETADSVGPNGGSGLLSNGDHNWPSGVISVAEFDVSEGLTVEFPARFQFTGQHWQELEAGLVPLSDAFTGNKERAAGAGLARWSFAGQSPRYERSIYSCSDGAGNGTGSLKWSIAEANRGWHKLVLQVRPDGYFECYLDGRLLGTFETVQHLRAPRAAVYLGGRSHATRIYHGPVLVTRGLRY